MSVSGFIAGVAVALLALAVALSAEQVFSEEKVPDHTVCATYITAPYPYLYPDDMTGIGEDTCWVDMDFGVMHGED